MDARSTRAARMISSPTRSIRPQRSAAVAGPPLDLTRKAETCARALAEARNLSAAGQFGALPNHLVVRAGELLDDIDEILVTLEPTGNGPSFAMAATLHRELEQILATLTELRRGVVPPRAGPR